MHSAKQTSETQIPADSVNMGDRIGYISSGRDADLVIADENFNIINVIHKGIIYWQITKNEV